MNTHAEKSNGLGCEGHGASDTLFNYFARIIVPFGLMGCGSSSSSVPSGNVSPDM